MAVRWICKMLRINVLRVFIVYAPPLGFFRLAIAPLSPGDRAGMASQNSPYRNAIGAVLERNKIGVCKSLTHNGLQKLPKPLCHSLLMTGKTASCQVYLPPKRSLDGIGKMQHFSLPCRLLSTDQLGFTCLEGQLTAPQRDYHLPFMRCLRAPLRRGWRRYCP